MSPLGRFSRFLPLLAFCAVSCEVQKPAAPRSTLIADRSAADANNPCAKSSRNPNTSVALLCVVSVPGNPILSADIAWVDPGTERYYIADRSNFGVDIIDAEHDAYVGRVAGMAGPAASGGGTATTNGPGPNGVVVTPRGLLWAGDGNSTVRVADVDPDSKTYLKTIASINTAVDECDDGTVHYCGRADEIGYDPEDHVILIAHPSPLATAAPHGPITAGPYAMFISTVPPYKILGHHHFKGAGGLEQPLWDPQIHRLLLTVPGSVAAGVPASIAVFNGSTRTVEKTYTLDCTALTGTAGVGITGIALGERHHLLVSACGFPIILDDRTGARIKVIKDVGGGDEVWYNSGDERFYVTGPDNSTPPVQSLGVIDADAATWLQNLADVRGKNPAAFAENNQIFTVATITAAIVAAPATDNSVCTLFGVKGTGCVAVFGHTRGHEGHEE